LKICKSQEIKISTLNHYLSQKFKLIENDYTLENENCIHKGGVIAATPREKEACGNK
jgi:hypothetical protein